MTNLQKLVYRALAILKTEKSEPVERAVALLNVGLRESKVEKAERVAEFIAAETVEAPGQSTIVSVLRNRFMLWIPREERAAWNRKKFNAEFRKHRVLKEKANNKLHALDTLLRMPE
jgi:hypothetical protein